MVNYKWLVQRSDTNQETEALNIPNWETRVNPVTLKLTQAIDAVRKELFTLAFPATGGQPPANIPPQIEVDTTISGSVGEEISMLAKITDLDGLVEDVNWIQKSGVEVILATQEIPSNYLARFTPAQAGSYSFEVEAFDNKQARTAKTIAVTVEQVNPPQPPTPGTLIYDSHRDSTLHDGVVQTLTKVGNIGAGGLGLECRASGSPKIQKNADKTFSLKCQSGHGRFYGYCKNYNVRMEIECAFWNSVSGQDLSLKLRSRHNEGGDCSNRFGGYGCAPDRDGWNAKRETCHNIHDQSKSGSLPKKPQTGQYNIWKFSVKDEGSSVRQTGEMDGVKFMDKVDTSPKAYMRDKASFEKQSYYWVRQNVDSGTGEIRIKSLKIFAL
jgi:hypothetical protein